MHSITPKVWQNWASNVTATPAQIFTPKTKADITEIRRARQR
jgi:hypothetical protein